MRPAQVAGVCLRLAACAGPLLGIASAPAQQATPVRPRPDVDARVVPLETLAPGTVVGVDAPAGWSHLILAAYPRIGQGDVSQVSRMVRELGELITFNMAAQVTRSPSTTGPAGWRLARVGWGLGTRINGRNTIVTYETCEKLGADLGFLGQEVLRRNQQGLQASFVRVAWTQNMSVCEHGGLVLHRNEHRWMTIRHAILVSRSSGRLTTLVWLLDQASADTCRLAEDRLQLLPPALQEDRIFNVKADRFTLGIPANDAFAVARIPQGTPLPIPTTLRSLAALRRYDAQQVVQLEEGLAKLLEP
jgi:hypothetical protein